VPAGAARVSDEGAPARDLESSPAQVGRSQRSTALPPSRSAKGPPGNDSHRAPGPYAEPDVPAAPAETGGRPPGTRHEHRGRTRRATLLQRVFEIDALRCPDCGSTMRRVVAIEDADVSLRILECLNLPARAPPLRECAGREDDPPDREGDWHFDQSTDCDEPQRIDITQMSRGPRARRKRPADGGGPRARPA